jgi:long-chain acyl-CoA synthetase
MLQPPANPTFWRVEGSLTNLSAVHPVAFFTWNGQTFLERWTRRGLLGTSALIRPFLYAADRRFSTRVLHTLLRGITRDRLDLLGEEYFHDYIEPRLNAESINRLKEVSGFGEHVVLASHGLDHIIRPLAKHLELEHVVANRLVFRDDVATGQLEYPVIRPRQALARFNEQSIDGTVSLERLCQDLGYSGKPEIITDAIVSSKRQPKIAHRPIVLFNKQAPREALSVRQSLAGKHIMLIGCTGFIGKVFLANLLSDLPSIGKIYLMIRGGRTTTAMGRFERMISESPVFDWFHDRYGEDLGTFLSKRLEVIRGDICQDNLGFDDVTAARLKRDLDIVINSSGLTDFNPDIRNSIAANIDGPMNLLRFAQSCDHVSLMHLSTCFVAGISEGRVQEVAIPDYTPIRDEAFDTESELQWVKRMIEDTTARSESDEINEMLRREILDRHRDDPPAGKGFERLLTRRRAKWLRTQLAKAGTERAKSFGWPNTYCYTKSIAESMLVKHAGDLPYTIVRPAIVETSTRKPFVGWNEGVNTSAPLSYLLSTNFRQLPSNERKCLDVVPVDVVCRGMLLISAALAQRCHEAVYQLGTSATNPCDMRRTIELTSLAHRKHFRTQRGFKSWFRSRCDAISVSKSRYQRFSAPKQKQMVRALSQAASRFTVKTPCLDRTEVGLDRIEKLIELYEPFILDHEQVFEAENVRLLSVALPEDELEDFAYDSAAYDWWDYWINIHIPALRRWSFPLLEGSPPQPARPRRFQMPAATTDRPGTSPGQSETACVPS